MKITTALYSAESILKLNKAEHKAAYRLTQAFFPVMYLITQYLRREYLLEYIIYLLKPAS